MKQIFVFVGGALILTLVVSFFLFNRSQNTNQIIDPDLEGYIMKIEDRRMLVVEKAYEEAPIDAGWLSDANSEKYAVGQFVKVVIDGAIAESYPFQAKAEEIEVVQAHHLQEPKSAEEDVLKSVIVTLSKEELFAVKSISFHKNNKAWEVVLQKLMAVSDEVTPISYLVDDETLEITPISH